MLPLDPPLVKLVLLCFAQVVLVCLYICQEYSTEKNGKTKPNKKVFQSNANRMLSSRS